MAAKRPLPDLIAPVTEQEYGDLGRAVAEAIQADPSFEDFVVRRLERLLGADWALA